jgi:hypothetical protein
LTEFPEIDGSTDWRDSLADLTEVNEDGAVVLSLDSAIQLGRVHSPLFQRQLDVLYRSSMNVAIERAGDDFGDVGGSAEEVLRDNLAAFSRFRQGFYTQIAIGELGVAELASSGDHRVRDLHGGGGGPNTEVGGFLGLLQQLQQIRYAEDCAHHQLRALSLLEGFLDAGVIDLAQVDQFRQRVEQDRAKLTQDRIDFERLLDCYKTRTLGLPPDLPVELDDSLIRPFQLVGLNATEVQNSIADLQDHVGKFPVNVGNQTVFQTVTNILRLVELLDRYMNDVRADLTRLDEAVPERERMMADEEMTLFQSDMEQLSETLMDLENQLQQAKTEVERLQDGLAEQDRNATVRGLVFLLSDFLRLVQRARLVQARARLECVTIDTIGMNAQDAFAVAFKNRADIMTARAELVRRSQEIAALRAGLGLGPQATSDRLLRTSRYRQSLIDYHQDHREYVEALDAVHQDLRQTLRSLEGLGVNLEIQRRAVAIAIRRVDLMHAPLTAPVPPPAPGQRPPLYGPTAAVGFMASLSDLRETKASFMRVWLNHLAARMVLCRDLGIMALDEKGRWADTPLPKSKGRESKETTPGNT